MGQRTLYVREPDEPVWKAAARMAKRRHTTLSALAADALKDYLPRLAAEPDPAEQWAAIAADESGVAA